MSLLPVGRSPQVALDGKGDVVAVWGYSTGLQVAMRRSGSDVWQPPVGLSGVGGWANEPQIAVDGRGDAIAVWTEYKGSDDVLEAAVMPGASGVWGPVEQLSSDGSNASYPQVRMDADGEATVVWCDYDHTTGPSVDFPRFRGHLSAWVERPGQGGSSAELEAAVSTGVPS